MSHINRYPYNAQHNSLLFDPPSRFADAKPEPHSGSHRTNVEDNSQDNNYSAYSYRRVPRGTAPPHPQPLEKTTTVYRRSSNKISMSILTVNSRDRVQVPRTVVNSSQQLLQDPLLFIAGSADVVVFNQDHGLRESDYVTLSGVSTPTIIINQPFETRVGSNFIRIEIVDGHSLTDILSMQDNLFVEIANVNSNLGSIPSNLINGLQKVYLKCDYSSYPSGLTGNIDTVSLNTNSRYIYINIPRVATSYYSDRSSPSNAPTNMGVTLKFQFIAGIPLYFMNTGYPRSLDAYDPYLQVASVIDSDSFIISLRQTALQTMRGGGYWIQLSSLSMADPGYLRPSNYRIDLPHEYKNVLQVELIGCAVPYSGYMVLDAEPGQNNSVYWQLLDDGSGTLYNANIPRGNYDTVSLATAMQNAMNKVIRLDTNTLHDFTVSINRETNSVAIALKYSKKLQKSMVLEYIPIVGTSDKTYMYVINSDTRITSGYQVTITQPNNFTPIPAYALQGTFTVLSTSVFDDMDVIAKSALTAQSVQQSFADRKNAIIAAIIALGYIVVFNNITLGSGVVYPIVSVYPTFFSTLLNQYDALDNTLTSYQVIAPVNQITTNVSYNSLFRMHFTTLDTLGSILGFRTPGNANSITSYQSTIYNTDLYDYETKLEVNPIIGRSTALNFHGDGYIYLCCPQLSSIDSTAPAVGSNASGPNSFVGVSNIFAKIHLDGYRGCMLYNTHVFAPRAFDIPITSLSSLDILLVTPDGREYDFNGIDHSFTFRITHCNSMPEDVGFNVNTGQLTEEIPRY
jgi:hypothetical protein